MSNFEADPDPFRSPEIVPPSFDHGSRPPAEGLITAVAVINYVFGGLQVACGACLAIFGATSVQMIGAIVEEERKMDPEGKVALGVMTAVIVGIGVVTALMGLPLVLAGYGVQNRKEWGRILTIVLAALSAFLGLLAFVGTNPAGFFYIGYAVFTLVVLLNSDNARAFR